jgi:hypothetical protein
MRIQIILLIILSVFVYSIVEIVEIANEYAESKKKIIISPIIFHAKQVIE